jgi:hypothetical protein
MRRNSKDKEKFETWFIKTKVFGQAWWLIPVILAPQKWRLGGSRFKANLGKKFKRPPLN